MTDVASTMQSKGYVPYPTGGGCMAWSLTIPEKFAIWICTGDNSLDGDPAAKDWLVGLYGPDGDWLNSHEAYTLDGALELAERLPRKVEDWAAWIEKNPNWYRN